MSIFNEEWDIVCNLGVKCNTLPFSREAGVRTFSSPFDNIDTVEGLIDLADLLSSRFYDYWLDIDNWRIRNDYAPKTNVLRAKVLWHKDFPGVFYPHFNEAWLSGNYLNSEELKRWRDSPELDIEPIFYDLKKIFSQRESRLVKMLDQGLNVLFLRVDESRSLRRIHGFNENNQLNYFANKVASSFVNSNVKVAYFYHTNENFDRVLTSNERVECIKIPSIEIEREFLIDKLKSLRVKSRDSVLKLGFNDSM